MQLSNYCNHLKLKCESEQKWDKTFQTYLIFGSFKHFEAPAHRTLSNFASKPLIKPHKGHWQDLTATNGSVAWKTWISCERLWKQVRFAELWSWLVPPNNCFQRLWSLCPAERPTVKETLKFIRCCWTCEGWTHQIPSQIHWTHPTKSTT